MVVSGGVAAAETGPRNCLGGLGAAGAVSVLGPTGSRVATVPALDTNPPRAIALSAKCLALQRTATLDLYDPATGAATGSLPLGAAAALRLVAVNSRLALLRGTRRLVLVRLSDGELLVFPLSSVAAAKLVGARLTEAGLFYAYNLVGTKKGRIVFEPTARLLSRF
jgi:hypothetical protein